MLTYILPLRRALTASENVARPPPAMKSAEVRVTVRGLVNVTRERLKIMGPAADAGRARVDVRGGGRGAEAAVRERHGDRRLAASNWAVIVPVPAPATGGTSCAPLSLADAASPSRSDRGSRRRGCPWS
jgi:hypothetical protein